MPEEEKENKSAPAGLNKEGAKAEEFIISNSNGNGINPNPIESGNSPEWDKGADESNQYKSDATDE